MFRLLPDRLMIVLAVLALAAGCEDSGSRAAQGEPAGPVSAAADLPAGTGFDFYVLALSWSPAYCEMEGGNANRDQCAPGRELGFVVHGLWPQFNTGYPEFCPTRQPDRVPADLGRNYLDILPSMGLIGHQWRKHGSCSGLSQQDYFKVVRAARDRIRIPDDFAPEKLPARIDATEAEAAFIAANPGMAREGLAVTCQRGLLREVRICLTTSLGFRDCEEVDRKGCRMDNLTVPEPD